MVGGNVHAPLIATYIGCDGSEPSYCFSCSTVMGSSLGGARSVCAGCMTEGDSDFVSFSVFVCCVLRLRRICSWYLRCSSEERPVLVPNAVESDEVDGARRSTDFAK